MKKQLLLVFASVFAVCQLQAQTSKLWSPHNGESSKITTDKGVARQSFPKEFKLYDLNIDPLREILFSVNGDMAGKHATIISLPNADGQIEQFEVYEASNFEPDLQAQFPQIRAYSGKGITDKYATLKLSISPQGIQTMVFRTDKENEFIEPYSQNHTVYAVYKSQREQGKLAWSCTVDDKKMVADVKSQLPNTNKSSAGQLKTMRLAQSVTAEYSNYFGATSAAQSGLVLAAVNTTLTRCNGVYEKDLALHLNLVAASVNVFYYDPLTDPYSDAGVAGSGDGQGADGAWNGQLQSTLTSVITEANYDIGHLFGASGGGGNAGCIGCVCVNGQKGSGFTSPGDAIPQGDNFDIDYVVHEVGHQLGGNHTYSHVNEGSGVNMEVASGVSIMGYAGVTAGFNVAPHSIDAYHAASIAQIQTNLAGKACPVTTNIAANNATPVANAGADITIPKSTPFMLIGSATDANAGDALTYSWEQYDNAANTAAQTGANSAAAIAKAGGPNWISWAPTASPLRYMPRIQTVLAASATTAGSDINIEALSSIARTLTFRLTVRDNSAYSSTAPVKVGQTSFDDRIVTIDATRGPLTVTSQNIDNQTWTQGTTQTITWAVNNTNASAGGTNVDILLSTDGGLTYPTVLVAATPNDGSQTITVPNIAATNCRVMVKASGSIFFNVNTKDIAIGYTVNNTCTTYNATIGANAIAAQNPLSWQAFGSVNVPTSYAISDLNVTVNITHPNIHDLYIGLVKPGSTSVDLVMFQQGCASGANMNTTFDDGGVPLVCGGINGSNAYKPLNALTAFNGVNSAGVWRLAIADVVVANNGTLNSYSLNMCSKTYTLANPEFEFQDFSLYPNPNNGNFTVKFTSASNNDIKINVHDMRGREVYEKSFSNTGAFNQNINLDKVQAGIYLVSIIDGAKKTVKRIVVE